MEGRHSATSHEGKNMLRKFRQLPNLFLELLNVRITNLFM